MNRNCDACDSCGNARVVDRCDDNCDRNSNRNRCDDDCSRNRDMLYGVPLAMGYVPWQNFECTYEPAQALQAGTIFPELDKPFYGRRGVRL
ncbi:MAG: spore coat associated protein CotJA [Agathobacter sp.]|nr:spore coat associated protein CotJA [Agathobacter sp.]MBQ3559972.1 spore coat associated protein CotJA [Agathobacter sp.]